VPQFPPSLLALADGTVFRGKGIGAVGSSAGEVVFNTAITGYQEILTDPSYCRQIVTLTYPHIGNYGINTEDREAARVHAAGLVIRDLPLLASNFRSEQSLDAYLRAENVVGIADIDTRKLTRILREKGAQAGCLVTGDHLDADAAVAHARAFPGLAGMDLAKVVSAERPYEWHEGEWRLGQGYLTGGHSRHHVVAYDFGVKRNILRMLAERGCKLTVVPAQTPAADVLAMKPDGIFLSNGPGDPEAADLRYLSWSPVAGLGGRWQDPEDEVWPPRRQPSGQGPRYRPGDDHQPEPWFRGRSGHAARQCAGDPCLAV
jgi:carbamoyl-phosphate synthase small subunit